MGSVGHSALFYLLVISRNSVSKLKFHRMDARSLALPHARPLQLSQCAISQIVAAATNSRNRTTPQPAALVKCIGMGEWKRSLATQPLPRPCAMDRIHIQRSSSQAT